MTQALVGVWYAKRRKIPCYIYVTDLWPENVEIITGIKNNNAASIVGFSLLLLPLGLSVLGIPVGMSFAIGVVVCIIGLITKD